MRSIAKILLVLFILLILLSSCQSPSYQHVERCDFIRSMDICRCSEYDFNIPEKVGEPYSKPIEYCEEKRVTFSFDEWQLKIVPIREAKRYLEQSKNKSEFKKRLNNLNKN